MKIKTEPKIIDNKIVDTKQDFYITLDDFLMIVYDESEENENEIFENKHEKRQGNV